MSVYTSIPINTYITTQAEADITSLGFVTISGVDTLVYTTVDGYLRIKELQSRISRSLDQGVACCFPLNLDAGTGKGKRIYYAKQDGSFWLLYLPNLNANPLKVQLGSLSFVSSPVSLGVIHGTNKDLPPWMMMINDGVRHYFVYAWDDQFSKKVVYRTVYDNTQGSVTTSHPELSLNPGGTLVTVAVQFNDLGNGESGVGTYVFPVLEQEGK